MYQIVTNMQLFGCEAKWASPPITLKHVLNIADSSCGLPIQPACVADRRRALATSGAILAERPSAELLKERFRDPQERQESSLGQGGFFKRLLNAGKLETLFCRSFALLEVMQFTTFGFLGLKSIYFITCSIKQSFLKKKSVTDLPRLRRVHNIGVHTSKQYFWRAWFQLFVWVSNWWYGEHKSWVSLLR